MTQLQKTLKVSSRPYGFVDISAEVQEVVRESGVREGLCVVFVQHTSASLVIQENADPSVREDLGSWLDDLAPQGRAWTHTLEGPDDMPAHAKTAVTGVSQTIPVTDGRLALGTWQGIYLWEHRRSRHTRRVVVHVVGES